MNNLSSASTFSLASGGGRQIKGHLDATVCALNFLPKSHQSLPARCSLGRVFSVLLLALVGVAASAAQTLKTSGTLEGTISDASGGEFLASRLFCGRSKQTKLARLLPMTKGSSERPTFS